MPFLISLSLVFGGSLVFTGLLEKQLKKKLRTFDEKSDRLWVNDKLADNAGSIIEDLVSYYPIRANHSAPEKRLRIKALIRNKEIALFLARDSKDSTIYWVYFPQYKFSRENKVWKLRTSLFNTYK